MSDITEDPMITLIVAEGLSAELLRVHIDDGTGHCAGCSWQQRARPVHPCPTRWYAERAGETLRRR
jgi:hypothetical protein